MHTSLFILQIGISSQGLENEGIALLSTPRRFMTFTRRTTIPNSSFLISHDRQRYEIAMTPNKYQLPKQLSI